MNQFNHKTRVLSGCGVLAQTGAEAAALGAQRVMVCTDSFMAHSPLGQALAASLTGAGLDWFFYEKVRPNPHDTDCDEGAALCCEKQVDLIIGFGGGSAMDEAKAIAAVLASGKPCRELDGVLLEGPTLPVICIPTTSGTGSETTCVAVITDTQRHFKMSVFDPDRLAPCLAICDPEATLSLPRSLTAACGVDALTHAIEAYTARVAQPITDALALHAMELIAQNLEAAFDDGQRLAAREAMMQASTIAGMAFIHSNVGAVHALAETIGAWYDTPHGVANALFLPHVMRFNCEAAPARYAQIALRLGISPDGKTQAELARAGADWVSELNRRLNIPTLRSLGCAGPDDFDAIAAASANNPLSQDNARPICKADYHAILVSAYAEA